MKGRIVALDVLRGFALLGILVMNIMSFAMPDIAYYNPTAYGGDDALNRLVYGATHVVADQKFMALFSLLFGAGVLLLLHRLEEQRRRPARTHFVRNLWLLAFGLGHSILLWSGDILTVYALCSFLLYFFRRLRTALQFTLGLLIFFAPVATNTAIQGALPYLDQASFDALEAYWQPGRDALERDIELFRDGGYLDQVGHRLGIGAPAPSIGDGQDLLDLSQLIEFFARALGMMLIGMAYYRWGVLTAERSDAFYRRLLVVGFAVGLPVALLGLLLYGLFDWQAGYSLFLGRVPNHVATLFLANAYLALIVLWCRRPRLARLRARLAAVGRMALSNYLGQSLLATFVFYGFGLGLYGRLDRTAQLLVVLALWAVQLALSSWWLRLFHYGPLEWLWRSLTYGSPQPLRRRGAPSGAA